MPDTTHLFTLPGFESRQKVAKEGHFRWSIPCVENTCHRNGEQP